jgi:predicted dehydrogenase
MLAFGPELDQDKEVPVGQNAVRLAVVGLGGWGRNVVRSFADARHCHLTYICDSNPASLQQHRATYAKAIATDDYRSILADAAVDAVAIATPAPTHFELARSALLAGKHVYVEKPMTLTTRDAEELVALAEQVDRKLMVGHLLEYHPAVDLIKQQIDSGSLGEIYYMYCQRLNLGIVRQQENVFWSLAPHDVSIILYLFGAEPDRVTACGERYLQSDIEDVVFVNLHFADGRMAQIHVSWLDPNKERKLVVVGSKKMLVFDDMQPAEKVRIFDKGASVRTEAGNAIQAISIRHGDIHIPHLSAAQPLDLETQHFIDAIRNNTCPRSDGHDGLRVVRILEEVERQLRGTLRIGDSPAQPVRRARVA